MAHFCNGSPTLFAVDVAAPRGYGPDFPGLVRVKAAYG